MSKLFKKSLWGYSKKDVDHKMENVQKLYSKMQQNYNEVSKKSQESIGKYEAKVDELTKQLNAIDVKGFQKQITALQDENAQLKQIISRLSSEVTKYKKISAYSEGQLIMSKNEQQNLANQLSNANKQNQDTKDELAVNATISRNLCSHLNETNKSFAQNISELNEMLSQMKELFAKTESLYNETFIETADVLMSISGGEKIEIPQSIQNKEKAVNPTETESSTQLVS